MCMCISKALMGEEGDALTYIYKYHLIKLPVCCSFQLRISQYKLKRQQIAGICVESF